MAASLGYESDGQPKTSTDQTSKGGHGGPRSRKNQRRAAAPHEPGLGLIGSAMNFRDFMTEKYEPTYLRPAAPGSAHLSSSTRHSYRGMIKKYLQPGFGRMCVRDLTRQTLQEHCSGMAGELSYPTISKIRDVLSSISATPSKWSTSTKIRCKDYDCRRTGDPDGRSQPSRPSNSATWCNSFLNRTRR